MIELTETDIFNLDLRPNAKDITIWGICLDTPLKEIYLQYKLSRRNIKRHKDDYYLKIAPGFKIKVEKRFFSEKLIGLTIDSEFKSQLKGAFAEVFSNIATEEQFRAYIKKYFSEPDSWSAVDDRENQYDLFVYQSPKITLSYSEGFCFTRFYTPGEKPGLVISISEPSRSNYK